MLCIAHRGARSERPENTSAAIELAIEQGCDGIEIDVRAHSGELIVFHDETVERVSNAQGAITDFSLDELRQLDLGGGQKIPLLKELISVINRRVPLNIELKDHASAPLVLSCLEEFVNQGWHWRDFSVSSFFHHPLQSLKQQQPKLSIGALGVGVMLDYAKFAQDLAADTINLRADSINNEVIEDAHRRGMKVWVYTVNEPRQFQQFFELGVDGLFTDYPLRLKQWLVNR